MTCDVPGKLGGLEALLASASAMRMPPVESWNPPYCGDIGLRIRSDGIWLYRGSPIGRTAMVKLFSTVLRRDEDGKHYLVTPTEKVDVVVDDAPFLAVEMESSASGRGQMLVFRTNMDDVVAAGAEHPIRFVVERPSLGLKPYVRVRGRLEALMTRSVYYELAALTSTVNRDGRDVMGLWSGGVFFSFSNTA